MKTNWSVILSLCLSGTVTMAMPVLAQDSVRKLPRQAQSVIYLHVNADKGVECGLLKPWERAAIKAQTLRITQRWSQDDSHHVADAIRDKIAKTQCDDAAMVGWISGSKKGFETEFLSPHLVMYRTMANMETPPKPFTAITQRLDYRDAISRIDAQFAALEASGAKAEGGKSWEDYRAGIAAIVTDSVVAMDSGTDPMSKKMREVQTMMATSAVLVESWLAAP